MENLDFQRLLARMLRRYVQHSEAHRIAIGSNPDIIEALLNRLDTEAAGFVVSSQGQEEDEHDKDGFSSHRQIIGSNGDGESNMPMGDGAYAVLHILVTLVYLVRAYSYGGAATAGIDALSAHFLSTIVGVLKRVSAVSN
jgi:hypothetical protein